MRPCPRSRSMPRPTPNWLWASPMKWPGPARSGSRRSEVETLAMKYRTKFCLVLMAAVLWTLPAGSPMTASQRGKMISQRIAQTDWAGIRGVNYIPSYGRNLYEMWRDYNHDAFDTELALARKVGYNSVRLWLNYFAFAERGAKIVDAVEDAVKLCRAHDLKVLITLSDGCGIRPRPNARRMTVKQAYDYFLAGGRPC